MLHRVCFVCIAESVRLVSLEQGVVLLGFPELELELELELEQALLVKINISV